MSTRILVRGTAWDPPLSPHALQNSRLAEKLGHEAVDVMQLEYCQLSDHLHYYPTTTDTGSYPPLNSSVHYSIGAQERSVGPSCHFIQSWKKQEMPNIMTCWAGDVGVQCLYTSGPSILPLSRRTEPSTMTCRRGSTHKEDGPLKVCVCVFSARIKVEIRRHSRSLVNPSHHSHMLLCPGDTTTPGRRPHQ